MSSQYNQTIALDAMGGDFGPKVVVPAASMALKALQNNAVKFSFYGDQDKITPFLDRDIALKAVSEIFHTDQIVTNEDKPAAALRRKDTSLRLAIDSVKAGQAQSIVSAGNTGALMATAKMVLKCLPGITRPAIASVFPTKKSDTVMLDLGANLSCDAQMLVQFAVLGSVYAHAVKGCDNPSVGLLNIGTEEVKGPERLREAASILSHVDFPGDFCGFVEGSDITNGSIDVVVTDGFTGNVALKVAEGVGDLAGHLLKDSFLSSPFARLGALLASGALKRFKKRVDSRFYNGGMFLGLDGVCVKSHGGMDSYGFSQAILVAAHLVERGYNKRVAHEMEQLMSQKSFLSGEALHDD